LGHAANIAAEQFPGYKSDEPDIAEARRELDHSIVRAPLKGMVTNVENLQRWQYLEASAAAFGLATTEALFIAAQPNESLPMCS